MKNLSKKIVLYVLLGCQLSTYTMEIKNYIEIKEEDNNNYVDNIEEGSYFLEEFIQERITTEEFLNMRFGTSYMDTLYFFSSNQDMLDKPHYATTNSASIPHLLSQEPFCAKIYFKYLSQGRLNTILNNIRENRDNKTSDTANFILYTIKQSSDIFQKLNSKNRNILGNLKKPLEEIIKKSNYDEEKKSVLFNTLLEPSCEKQYCSYKNDSKIQSLISIFVNSLQSPGDFLKNLDASEKNHRACIQELFNQKDLIKKICKHAKQPFHKLIGEKNLNILFESGQHIAIDEEEFDDFYKLQNIKLSSFIDNAFKTENTKHLVLLRNKNFNFFLDRVHTKNDPENPILMNKIINYLSDHCLNDNKKIDFSTMPGLLGSAINLCPMLVQTFLQHGIPVTIEDIALSAQNGKMLIFNQLVKQYMDKTGDTSDTEKFCNVMNIWHNNILSIEYFKAILSNTPREIFNKDNFVIITRSDEERKSLYDKCQSDKEKLKLALSIISPQTKYITSRHEKNNPNFNNDGTLSDEQQNAWNRYECMYQIFKEYQEQILKK